MHDSVGRYVYWQFCEKLQFNGISINWKVYLKTKFENSMGFLYTVRSRDRSQKTKYFGS